MTWVKRQVLKNSKIFKYPGPFSFLTACTLLTNESGWLTQPHRLDLVVDVKAIRFCFHNVWMDLVTVMPKYLKPVYTTQTIK